MFFNLTGIHLLHTKRCLVKLIGLKIFLTFLLLVFLTNLSAQELPTVKVAWNGYAQLRFTS